jgi:ATP-binding protein involved in chromosome partitioning
MSMGYLVTDKTPLVWRGPMASSALQQMLKQTLWSDLDYLIVDMPPGTGDIQLTMSQQVDISGAVIVTTPQDIALLDAKKGIEMFNEIDIPVLGIIENMATHLCSCCGHQEHIFGLGGGERIAKDYRVPMLGALPLELKIRQHTDEGRPTVISEPSCTTAETYREIARKLTAQLAQQTNSNDVIQLFTNADSCSA